MSNQVEKLAHLLLPKSNSKVAHHDKEMSKPECITIASPYELNFKLKKLWSGRTLLSIYDKDANPLAGIQLTRRELVELMGLMNYYWENVLLKSYTELEKRNEAAFSEWKEFEAKWLKDN